MVVEVGGDGDELDRSGVNPSLSSRLSLPDPSLSSSSVDGWHDDKLGSGEAQRVWRIGGDGKGWTRGGGSLFSSLPSTCFVSCECVPW